MSIVRRGMGGFRLCGYAYLPPRTGWGALLQPFDLSVGAQFAELSKAAGKKRRRAG